MYFIHDELISHVAENIYRDKNRLKFSFISIPIKLKGVYFSGFILGNSDRFIFSRVNIISYSSFLEFLKAEEKIRKRIKLIHLEFLEDHYSKIDFGTYAPDINKLFPNLENFRIDFKVLLGIKNSYLDRYITHMELTFYPYNINFSEFKNLKYLSLPYFFDGDIKDICRLKSLEYLEFGTFFNGPIDSIKDLKNLKHIIFSNNFSQPINILKEIPNLTKLEFGYMFDKDISVLAHLKNLKHIQIPKSYENVVHNYVSKNVKIDFI